MTAMWTRRLASDRIALQDRAANERLAVIKAQAEFGKTSLAAAWAELLRQGDNISLLMPKHCE
jgi:ATP/maltotriose-dependent transcriptional regulator MalT